MPCTACIERPKAGEDTPMNRHLASSAIISPCLEQPGVQKKSLLVWFDFCLPVQMTLCEVAALLIWHGRDDHNADVAWP